MHLMPTHASSVAKIIGIDPGSESLGLACIDFDVNTLAIQQTTSQTYVGSKMGMNEWMMDVHSARFARIDAHRRNLWNVLNIHHPFCVVCESPFFNPGRPMAFEVLIEVLNMIRQTIWEYDRHMPLHLIDPPSVKRAVKAKGNAKKEEMTVAVNQLTDLNYVGLTPLVALDEHSIDAIAVAYYKLNEYRGK